MDIITQKKLIVLELKNIVSAIYGTCRDDDVNISFHMGTIHTRLDYVAQKLDDIVTEEEKEQKKQ